MYFTFKRSGNLFFRALRKRDTCISLGFKNVLNNNRSLCNVISTIILTKIASMEMLCVINLHSS